MKHEIEALCAGEDLTSEHIEELFSRLIHGDFTDMEVAGLIVAMKAKGERPGEIAGAARALRAGALAFPRPDYAFADTCGTGGDGAHTVNISTAAAFVTAAAGLPVAKHGNRSVSSKCGSADVLEASGVSLNISPERARECLDEANICFLFAPSYHSGIKHAMPARRALRTRTIFNLLGPLVNPAAPPHQVVGVYAPELCEPMARTLGMLGVESALVVHGSGVDEVALHGPTTAALYRDSEVTMLELCPEEAGLPRYPLDALRGGEPSENAAWLRDLLEGKGQPAHNAAVAINVGALLMVSGRVPHLHDGVELALDVLRSGAASAHLDKLVEVSNAR